MVDKKDFDLRSLKGLNEYAEALGLIPDPHWKIGTLRRKIEEAELKGEQDENRASEPQKAIRVTLLKNFVPAGWYRIVGHRNAEGDVVEGMAPPRNPGSQPHEHKIWAETIVELTPEEARRLQENVVVESVVVEDEFGRKTRRDRKRRMPLAEVMIA